MSDIMKWQCAVSSEVCLQQSCVTVEDEARIRLSQENETVDRAWGLH